MSFRLGSFYGWIKKGYISAKNCIFPLVRLCRDVVLKKTLNTFHGDLGRDIPKFVDEGPQRDYGFKDYLKIYFSGKDIKYRTK